MVEANKPQQAGWIIKQLGDIPESRLGPAERRYKTEFYEDFVAVKEHSVVSDKLSREIERLSNTSLEEGAGEGWHRTTQRAKQVAPASELPWLLGSSRSAQNLTTCTCYLQRCAPRGDKVFRYDFMKVKRLLQTNVDKRFTPVRMKDEEFYKSLYCISDQADDWGPLLGEPAAPASTDASGGVPSLRHEWMRAVLKPSSYYSVPIVMAGESEDGPVEVIEIMYFQVLSIQTGSSRHKLTPTAHEDDEGRALAAGVCVNVQHLDCWIDHSASRKTVMFEAGAEFASVLDLAPWEKLKKTSFSCGRRGPQTCSGVWRYATPSKHHRRWL